MLDFWQRLFADNEICLQVEVVPNMSLSTKNASFLIDYR